MGCQTVFISMNAVIRCGLISSGAALDHALHVLGRRLLDRLRPLPACSPRRRSRSRPCAPRATAAAPCDSRLSTFTTPPAGRSWPAPRPASGAGSGCDSDASTTTVLPPHSAGATRRTRPASAGSSGATMPTTPVGSGIVKLKYGPATGLMLPATWASLSVQPAYQTSASTACSTSRRGAATAAEHLDELGSAGRRASRPRGTGSGRGSWRSAPPSRAGADARPAPRRAGPCASRAAR